MTWLTKDFVSSSSDSAQKASCVTAAESKARKGNARWLICLPRDGRRLGERLGEKEV